MPLGLDLCSITTRLADTILDMISGSYESLMRLLEEAFEAGFSSGFWTEDNPADYLADWEDYKKTLDI
jgi:hypothetical protein